MKILLDYRIGLLAFLLALSGTAKAQIQMENTDRNQVAVSRILYRR